MISNIIKKSIPEDNQIKCIYPRRVNADMINVLPMSTFGGDIELVETDEHLDRVLPEILSESILGFDTETRPNFSKDRHYLVSILQLGGVDKVWVIRLEPLKHRLYDIYQILENPDIKKVGVAVHGDIISLKERLMFMPAAFVDIAQYTKKIGVINTGMRNLAGLVLGVKISKSSQLTNWASDNLTAKQIEYAATDAWISRELYIELKNSFENTNIAIEPEPIIRKPFSFKLLVGKIVGSFSKKSKSNKKKVERKKLANSRPSNYPKRKSNKNSKRKPQ